MNIRALIVDDEPLARARLLRLLKQIDAVDVVGTAVDGQQAIAMVDAVSPNLIFMDVQMPKLNGIDAAKKIARQFEDDPPAIIFCTAYDHYAIDAFKADASDYLLKPVSVADLESAIKRACRVSQLGRPEHLQEEMNYVSIKHTDYVEKLPITQVNYFRSEGKFVVAGLVGDDEVFVDSTLKELEQKYFLKVVRVHRSSLVAREKLSRLVRSAHSDHVELIECEKTFMVSRRMLNEVKKCFD